MISIWWVGAHEVSAHHQISRSVTAKPVPWLIQRKRSQPRVARSAPAKRSHAASAEARARYWSHVSATTKQSAAIAAMTKALRTSSAPRDAVTDPGGHLRGSPELALLQLDQLGQQIGNADPGELCMPFEHFLSGRLEAESAERGRIAIASVKLRSHLDTPAALSPNGRSRYRRGSSLPSREVMTVRSASYLPAGVSS